MGKKKKNRKLKTTVYAVYEGKREGVFLKLLGEIYKPDFSKIKITYKNANGGSADTGINFALKAAHKNTHSFTWLDEDFQIQNPPSIDALNGLAKCWGIRDDKLKDFMGCSLGNLQSNFNQNNRNPLLIVSQPIAVESMILLILDVELPYYIMDANAEDVTRQCKDLKNKLASFFDGGDELKYYQRNISRELLEDKRKVIPELDLLISMITK